MREAEPIYNSLRFGFRRRCAWCGVVLRGWQLNRCRRCKTKGTDAGPGLQGGGPPCPPGARWDAEPDERPFTESPDWPRCTARDSNGIQCENQPCDGNHQAPEALEHFLWARGMA